MFQTCSGSLHIGLGAQPGESLLIRGGTSSIWLAVLAMPKSMGLTVATTTRNPAKADTLLSAGADEVFVDSGSLREEVRARFVDGVDRVLELIGTTTLLDSLQCARPGGVVCMTGILGGEWELAGFRPMGHIPIGVRLTSYSGGASDITPSDLQRYITLVDEGRLEIRSGAV